MSLIIYGFIWTCKIYPGSNSSFQQHFFGASWLIIIRDFVDRRSRVVVRNGPKVSSLGSNNFFIDAPPPPPIVSLGDPSHLWVEDMFKQSPNVVLRHAQWHPGVSFGV